MQNIKKLEQEIDTATNVKSLAIAYEEISIMRMQKIRDMVLSSRYYLDNLYPVFKEVRKAYVESSVGKSRLLKMSKKGELSKSSFSTMIKNGRNVVVLITPNNRMSGNLAKSVIADFLDDMSVSDKSTDYVIIGKLGANLLRNSNTKLNNKNVLYFDLPDTKSEIEILRIIESVMHYDKVVVYYGKFKNLIERVSSKDEISAEYEQVDEKSISRDSFIIEPQIDKVLNFFEIQVFTVLFKQRLSESELGMLGSRISAMEAAISKSEQKVSQLMYQRRVYRKKEDQKKQIQRVITASLSKAY